MFLFCDINKGLEDLLPSWKQEQKGGRNIKEDGIYR